MKNAAILWPLLALCGVVRAQTWTWQNPLPQGNTLTAVRFVDTWNGWAVGEGGSLVHTSDGGATWTQQNSGTTGLIDDVYFTDASNGWAVSEYHGDFVSPGLVLRTTDGGQTWVEQSTGVFGNYHDIDFADGLNGWIVGQGGLMLRTTDGGETWTEQPRPTPNILLGVDFVDAASGWAVGVNGTILRFTSSAAPVVTNPPGDVDLIAGGDPFSRDLSTVFSNPDEGVLTYTATSSNEGVASVLVAGSVLTVTPLAVGTAVITVTAQNEHGAQTRISFTVHVPTGVPVEHEGGMPEVFALVPNIPNPFNPATVIGFALPEAGRVRLEVFDVLGRRVAVLVDEHRGPGRYTVTWEAASAPSGIYLYRLQAGNYAGVKTMVLRR